MPTTDRQTIPKNLKKSGSILFIFCSILHAFWNAHLNQQTNKQIDRMKSRILFLIKEVFLQPLRQTIFLFFSFELRYIHTCTEVISSHPAFNSKEAAPRQYLPTVIYDICTTKVLFPAPPPRSEVDHLLFIYTYVSEFMVHPKKQA